MMPSSHHTSNSGRSNCCMECSKEWDRLQLVRKRLELQQERLTLDQEMLKAEKRKLKKTAKLSKSGTVAANNESDLQKSHAMAMEARNFQLEQEITDLKDRIIQYHKEKEEYEIRLAAARQQRDNPGNVAELQKELSLCQQELLATHRSLSSTFRERDLFREQNDSLQQELNEIKAKLEKSQKETERVGEALSSLSLKSHAPTSPIPEVCAKCEHQQLRIVSLEEDLQHMKKTYALAAAKHAEEKQQWQQEIEAAKIAIEAADKYNKDNAFSEDYVNDLKGLLKQYEDENENLRQENRSLQRSSPITIQIEDDERFIEQQKVAISEAIASKNEELSRLQKQFEDERRIWEEKMSQQQKEFKEEKECLERQLNDQDKKMENWKLLLPRNKKLLEQTQAKNEQMKIQLDEARQQAQNYAETVNDYKAKNGELEKRIEDYTSRKEMSATDTTSSSFSSDTVLIPSDMTHDNLMELRMTKKHVIEWEWANPNGLGGMYTGWLDLEGFPDGHGTLRIEDGSVYTGGWKKGRKTGNGVYSSIDGALYSGPWWNDEFHGRGVYVSETNQVYTGDFNHNLREGRGIETWEYGAQYVGQYRSDKRNGYGSYTYPDGRKFEGEYKDDQPNGKGKQTASDGAILYDGAWSMGEFLS